MGQIASLFGIALKAIYGVIGNYSLYYYSKVNIDAFDSKADKVYLCYVRDQSKD